jgi:hypothetical protein
LRSRNQSPISNIQSNPTLAVCLDADRLDLGRVGITPDPLRLSTSTAKSIARATTPANRSSPCSTGKQQTKRMTPPKFVTTCICCGHDQFSNKLKRKKMIVVGNPPLDTVIYWCRKCGFIYEQVVDPKALD